MPGLPRCRQLDSNEGGSLWKLGEQSVAGPKGRKGFLYPSQLHSHVGSPETFMHTQEGDRWDRGGRSPPPLSLTGSVHPRDHGELGLL